MHAVLSDYVEYVQTKPASPFRKKIKINESISCFECK